MTAASDDGPEFPLPRRFGRYVLFDHIGRGGMAEIYLARGTTQMGAARLAVKSVEEMSEDKAKSRAMSGAAAKENIEN